MTDWEGNWAILEKEASRPGMSVRRVRPEERHDLFVGIEHPALTRTFFIEVPRKLVQQVGVDMECTGFLVRREGVPDRPDWGRLVVRLQERRYAEVFSSLAADVFSSIPPDADDRGVLEHTMRRLVRWKQFMAARGEEGLSRQQRQGLYGELWFLLSHAIPVCGVARAVAAWGGPRGRPQDFEFATSAVEVKTTTAVAPEGIQVASARQLDPPAEFTLLLLHIMLEERSGAGETLTALVSRVRAAAVGRELELEDLLLQAGYLDADSARYSAAGYIVRRHRFFEAGARFPRLTEAMLPAGVTDVAYTISLAACEPFTALDDKVHSAIGGVH